MVDVDWFLNLANNAIAKAEQAIIASDHQLAQINMLGGFVTWLNIRLMQRSELVIMTDEQQREFDYLKFKLVQFAAYLPDGADKASLI